MPDLNLEEYTDSDVSENEEQHSKLLTSVSQLDSNQRVKPALRKEISSEVSEFNLTESQHGVNVKDLVRVLNCKPKHAAIARKFQKISKTSKTLPKPLEKPVEEKIKRSVGFVNVKNQLKRWNAVVARNSLKDHISFPLNNSYFKMPKSNEFLNQFKAATPLEMEIAKVLKKKVKDKNDKEKKDEEFPLTLEEVMEKRKEMAQLRAKLSYREAKAQRQSKIKSKKYHRILKREKLRQQLKEFELLQKTDPEAALKKLSELDKSRAQERASLRHRNTGQWAKNMTVRAKYNIESRKVLAEQLKISREITQKVKKPDSSDEEDAVEVPSAVPLPHQELSEDKDNPWSVKVSEDVKNFVSSYKKYWNEQNKESIQNQSESEKNVIVSVQKSTENNENSMGSNENSMASNEKSMGSNEKSMGNNKKSMGSNEKSMDNNEKSTSTHENKNTEVKKNEKTKSNKTISVEQPMKTKSSGKKPIKPVNNSPNDDPVDSSPKKKKRAEPCVSIQSTSGIWIVTPVTNENISKPNKKSANVCDIDTLFEDLSDKLISKAAKKVKKIERKLKNETKRKKKQEKNQVKDEEADLMIKNTKIVERPDMDVGLIEGKEGEVEPEVNRIACDGTSNKKTDYTLEIDPKKFIQVKPKKLQTHLPNDVNGNVDAIDDEEAQQIAIEEAFGDDDVLDEFNAIKKEEEKNNQVEIITSLPGWGEWGGTGIKPNPRKTRRLMLNLPERKDKKLKDVIMCENENPKLKNHLVKEVPHPFKSLEAFEANIRAPVGRDWVPETAHQKLIQKQVETQMGAVIQPMDESEIVKREKKSKSPFVGKKKKDKS